MDPPRLLPVGLVLLLGALRVMVPGVPGTWLVWAGLQVWAGLLWRALHERSSLSWTLLAAATALLLVVQVVKWRVPAAPGSLTGRGPGGALTPAGPVKPRLPGP